MHRRRHGSRGLRGELETRNGRAALRDGHRCIFRNNLDCVRVVRVADAVDLANLVRPGERPGLLDDLARAHRDIVRTVAPRNRARVLDRRESELLSERNAVRRLPHAVYRLLRRAVILRGKHRHDIAVHEYAEREDTAAEIDLRRLHAVVHVRRGVEHERECRHLRAAGDVEDAPLERGRVPQLDIHGARVGNEGQVGAGKPGRHVGELVRLADELARRFVVAPFFEVIFPNGTVGRGPRAAVGERIAEDVVLERKERVEAPGLLERAGAVSGRVTVNAVGARDLGRCVSEACGRQFRPDTEPVAGREDLTLPNREVPVVRPVGGVLGAAVVDPAARRVELGPGAVGLATRDAAFVHVAFPWIDGGHVETAVRADAEVVDRLRTQLVFLLVGTGVGIDGEDRAGAEVVIPVAAAHEDESIAHAHRRGRAGVWLARRPARRVGVAQRLHRCSEVGNVRPDSKKRRQQN